MMNELDYGYDEYLQAQAEERQAANENAVEVLSARLRSTCRAVDLGARSLLDQDKAHVILGREQFELLRGVAERNLSDLEAGLLSEGC